VGQLVRAVLDRGCRRIVIALGGSATVDGGSGLLEALGVRLLDAAGNAVARGGGGLDRLERLDVAGLDPRLAEAEVFAICDVDNPLLGEHGAARVFGPQKGATLATVARLEANLAHWAAVIERDLGQDVRAMRHGGAAGGMAAGIAGVLGGRLLPGAAYVLERLGAKDRIAGQDVVLTAEGHIDSQTLQNKAPYALARLARAAGVPIVALAGGISDDVRTEAFEMFDAIVPICPRPMGLEAAMGRARASLVETAERVGRLFQIGARVPVAPRAT
jgi:glycerate kinase